MRHPFMKAKTLSLPSLREWLLLALLYFGFGMFYMITLYLSFVDYDYEDHYLNWNILVVDYPLKALFSLPIWYLIFHVLRDLSLDKKLLINLTLMPLWIKGWQVTYYFLCDNLLDAGHLRGSGEWWDIYIPGLFYCVQFGILHAWQYHKDFRRIERARAESESLALKSELSALKAQLNPHFLYNALNTISASVGPAQEGTRKMVAQLSDLFRYQLVANRREFVPLREELDFVTDYLRLEHARFGERLTFDVVSVERTPLENVLIPPMLLQPLVENAVRHGISPSLIGGEVHVKARAAEAGLELVVFNTGKPCDPHRSYAATGYGLANTRRRLALLFDAKLDLSSSPEGTTCTFTIPLQYATDRPVDRRRSARPQLAARIPERLPGI
ncbi:MAG: histidine kinase [Bacteroidota bacterium]